MECTHFLSTCSNKRKIVLINSQNNTMTYEHFDNIKTKFCAERKTMINPKQYQHNYIQHMCKSKKKHLIKQVFCKKNQHFSHLFYNLGHCSSIVHINIYMFLSFLPQPSARKLFPAYFFLLLSSHVRHNQHCLHYAMLYK